MNELNKFIRYEMIRRLGHFNMVMQAYDAANAAGLTYNQYLDVVYNYNKYLEIYFTKDKVYQLKETYIDDENTEITIYPEKYDFDGIINAFLNVISEVTSSKWEVIKKED